MARLTTRVLLGVALSVAIIGSDSCATIARIKRATAADSTGDWAALWSKRGTKSPSDREEMLKGATVLAGARLSRLRAAVDRGDVAQARGELGQLQDFLQFATHLDAKAIPELERRLGGVRLDSRYLEGAIASCEAKLMVTSGRVLDGLQVLRPFASEEREWDRAYRDLVALDLSRVATKVSELIVATNFIDAAADIAHGWQVLAYDDGYSSASLPQVGLDRVPFRTWINDATEHVRDQLEKRVAEQLARNRHLEARTACIAALSIARGSHREKVQTLLETRVIRDGVRHHLAQADKCLSRREYESGLEHVAVIALLDPKHDLSRLKARLEVGAADQEGAKEFKRGNDLQRARRYPEAVLAYRRAIQLLIEKGPAIAAAARAKSLAMRKIAILPIDDKTGQYSGRESLPLLTQFQDRLKKGLDEFHEIVPARRVEEILREFRWNHLDLSDQEVKRVFHQRLGADYVVDVMVSNYRATHRWSQGEQHPAATRTYLGQFIAITYNGCGLILSQRVVDRYHYEPASYTRFSGSAQTAVQLTAALYSVEQPVVVSELRSNLEGSDSATRAESDVDPSRLFERPSVMGDTEERTSPIDARMFNGERSSLGSGKSLVEDKVDAFLANAAKEFAVRLHAAAMSGDVAIAKRSSR